ncbi:MAG: ATP-binding cassette domain-containing protein, partial [Clostridia bacterium]
MELLRVSNIEKSFGTNHVLKGVSLSVSKNEVVSIIGRSGSGKSTLLRCATLLERVSAGSIFIDGEAMVEDGHYAPKASLARIRRRLGLVFQDFNLFPHFSVLRNVMEAQTVVLGKTQDEAKKTALDLLEKMGIADKA